MEYQFVTPEVKEQPMAWNVLHVRYPIPRGISVIQRWDDTTYQARYPAQTELEEAKRFWLGGHIHRLDQATRDYLVAQGYGPYITPIP